jgi:hypothetical protein
MTSARRPLARHRRPGTKASHRRPEHEPDRQHLYRIKYRQADPETIDEGVTAA